MDKAELKRKPINQLEKDLADLREQLRDLRFRVSQNQLKQVREVRAKRREIATVLTELQSRKKNK